MTRVMPTPPVVLVVEDHPELRHVLRDALGAEGYQVLSASDEPEAIALLRDRPVDLLVADLPGSADEAGEVLATLLEEFPELPVIVLAQGGRGGDIFFVPWETSGTRRTLRRPFKLSDLLAAARDVLGEPVESALD